jgi:hypothetical protein
MAVCYLKDTLPQRVRADCCVSGYRPDAVGRRQYTHEPVGGPLPPTTPFPEDETDIQRITQPLSTRRDAIWPTSAIPVCWEDFDAAFANERSWVQQAVADTWEAHSAVRFQGWGECQSDASGIRIRVADENPRVRRLGTGLDGMAGGMTLNFRYQDWDPSCGSSESEREYCIRATAVHEFGHALGFAHEQNRADAPIWCRDQAQGTDGNIFMTPYDPDSVMNYCNAYWNNGGSLSAHDMAGLQFWYGPEPSSGVPWLPSCRTDVLLYQKANYGGRWLKIYGTIARLHVEDFNDRASSLCVPAGYRLVVYEHSHFQGASVAFDGPISIRSLQETSGGGVSNWGDAITSVQLIDLATGEVVYDAPPSCDNTPVLFRYTYFRGNMVLIGQDEPLLGNLDFNFNDRLSSVCVPAGRGIRIWEHPNFLGESLDIVGPSFLQQMPSGWNDKASSVQLVPSP